MNTTWERDLLGAALGLDSEEQSTPETASSQQDPTGRQDAVVTPLLERIHEPKDLRALDYGQLNLLCGEIRDEIVSAVSELGGHLGSNLGVVELTVALHRVFDAPRDILLWDTGHQAYVHKMLTGRTGAFSTLRQEGGLSGYPSRGESEHDWIENSHASTVLGYAHGLATAEESPVGQGRRIVAIIGDGSMTGGMAFEGLNNLGASGRNVTIILNDNGRSYAPTVGLLTESLIKIRSNPIYMRRQHLLKEWSEAVPILGETVEKTVEAAKAAVRQLLEPPAFFETLGVHYLGPFDGHDVAGLEQALTNASEFSGPVVVHVRTQKGRGHAPAENDPIKLMHDLSVIKPGSYTEAFTEAIVRAGEEHPELIAITAAMPDSTGLLPFRDRFPDRVVDVGIAEQHAVTAAAGMAMGGLRPVVAVYSTFLTRAFDQLNLDVGLHGLPVIFCLDRAGITGDDGASHHGVLDIVLCSKVPGITIFAPSSFQELQRNFEDAFAITDGPVVIRWSKAPAPSVPDDQVGSGIQARRAREGKDVCILALGNRLEHAMLAAADLAEEGIECTVWDPRVVTPPDSTMLDDASKHALVVTVEDGYAQGGFGSLVASELSRRNSDSEVEVLGVPIEYIPHAKPDSIFARLGLDRKGIAAAVQRRSQ